MTSLLLPLFCVLLALISFLSFLHLSSPSSLHADLSPLGFALFSNLPYFFLQFYVLYLHTLLPTLWGPTAPLNFTSPPLLVYALPLFLFSVCSCFFPLPHTQFNFHCLCRSLLSVFQRSGESVTACEAIGAWMTSSYQKSPEPVTETMWVQRNRRKSCAECLSTFDSRLPSPRDYYGLVDWQQNTCLYGTCFTKSQNLPASPSQKQRSENPPLTGWNLEQDQAYPADAEWCKGGGEERQMGQSEEHQQHHSLLTSAQTR